MSDPDFIITIDDSIDVTIALDTATVGPVGPAGPAGPPGANGSVIGPVTTAVGDFAAWDSLNGTLLKDFTPAQATAALNAFTSTLKGLAPPSGGGTANFLRADGTWAAAGVTFPITGTGATVVASTPLLDLSQTWNNVAVAFTALKLNITNTASAAYSAALDLQLGGTTQFAFYIGGTPQFQIAGTGFFGNDTAGNWTGFQLSSASHRVDFWASAVTSGLSYSNSGLQFANDRYLSWGSGTNGAGTADVILYRDAAGILAQRNGVNAQAFRVYKTYSDAANYSAVRLDYGGTGEFRLWQDYAGTGTAQALGIFAGANLELSGDTSSAKWAILANSGTLQNVGQTVTASTPILNLSQTWNNVAADFTALKLNVTRTASSGNSLLMDLQINAGSFFTVGYSGGAPSLWLGQGSSGANNYNFQWFSNSLFVNAASQIALTLNNAATIFSVVSAGAAVQAAARIGWSATADAGSATDINLYRDAAGILAQRNGVNAQTLRVYNTTDAGITNYERAIINWSANVLNIGTQKAGTGVGRIVAIGSNPTGNPDAALWVSGTPINFTVDGGINWKIESTGQLIKPAHTVTSSLPLLDMSQTWNNAAVVFTALKLNVTNTASNGGFLLDLQLGGTTKFNVDFGGSAVASSLFVRPGVTTYFAANNGNYVCVNGGTPFGFTNGDANNNPDVALHREGAGLLSLANGANAQALRVYNTTDGGLPPTNYERAVFDWTTTANVLTIGMQAGGTGTWRSIAITNSGQASVDIYGGNGGNVNIRNANSGGAIVATVQFGGGNQLFLNNATDIAWGTNPQTSIDLSINRVAAKVLQISGASAAGGGGTPTGWLNYAGQTRVTADFSVTSSTALTNVTGLSVNVQAGRTYTFEAQLQVTDAAAGGVQAAIAGTATATAIQYTGWTVADNAIKAKTNSTALGTAVGSTVTTETTGIMVQIYGTITVNVAGTLTVQMAQNTSNATATIAKRGSYFIVHDMP